LSINETYSLQKYSSISFTNNVVGENPSQSSANTNKRHWSNEEIASSETIFMTNKLLFPPQVRQSVLHQNVFSSIIHYWLQGRSRWECPSSG